MAPEVMEQAGGYDFRADIWSLGITALELAKGVAPYAHLSAMKVLVLTIEEAPPSLKTYSNDRQRDGAPFSNNFDDFYRKCLQKNPKIRPSSDELLKHKFLRNRSCYALVDQLLKHIPSVGRSIPTRPSGEEQRRKLLPGEGSVAIELIERKNVLESDDTISNNSSLKETDSCTGDYMGISGKSHLSCSSPNNQSGNIPSSPIRENGYIRSGSGGYSVTGHTNNNNSAKNPYCPTPPVYVSGTTWVFDGDGDDDHSSLGSGADRSRILRISSRIPGGRSGTMSNGCGTGTGTGHSYSVQSRTASFSSSSAKNDDFHNNNGIDSFLADFEADAATIKSTKIIPVVSVSNSISVSATLPVAIIPDVGRMTISPTLPYPEINNVILIEIEKVVEEKDNDNDNDAFMDEMEDICS